MSNNLTTKQTLSNVNTYTKTMTKAEISSALPPTYRGTLSNDLVDSINNIINTTELCDTYKEQFICYSNVLADARFSLELYVNAVRYVSLKSLGHTNISAWSITFPNRIARLTKAKVSNTHIHNHVRSYSSSMLVTKILAQAMTPSWLLNQHHYQDAINRQVYLMHNAKSETVQSNAAKCLVDALGKPEVAEIEITHNVSDSNDNSAIEIYKREARKLAQAQLEAIKNGVTLEAIAESKLESTETDDDV